MLIFEPWKRWLIATICLLGAMNILPNFFYDDVVAANAARKQIAHAELVGKAPSADVLAEAARWPSYLPGGVVNLGLDLQGGSYFLLELQTDELFEARLSQLQKGLGARLRAAGVNRYRNIRRVDANTIGVSITNLEDVEAAGAALRELSRNVGDPTSGVISSEFEVELVGERDYQIRVTEAARATQTAEALDAAIEVIRTRVDALGTREPTIQREGKKRILLQLPGESNVDIDSMTKPSKLEFRMVAMQYGDRGDVPAVRVGSNPLPAGLSYFEYDPDLNPDRQDFRIALQNQVLLTGDSLADAYQGITGQNEVGVFMRLDPTGATVFRRITRENLGDRFAMVLDGKVLSAPTMQAVITDGVSVITGEGINVRSAQALSINMRSGSLPAEVTVENSAEVGPELGADSVAAGKLACIIGFIAVLIYMAVSYGWFGLLANTALLINVLLIFGALSMFGSTLTLPGIAGIVLTIGMAVDANVLVFERIREELRAGRNVVHAIETGYSRALSAIIDANITTFLAAAILFFIGAGPVKGFAVTLGIGIITSVFTAVMLTRFFVASWYGWKRPKTLEL